MNKTLSSDIESIPFDERDALSYTEFHGVTPGGTKFSVSMLGSDRQHAYKRINNQTHKSVSFPAIIGEHVDG